MAKHIETTVRYDGPALKDHQMDVQELAPALLALAEMIQLANKKLNGNAASMKVLVKADVEQKCFQLDIHLVQTILESAKHLFGTEEYKTAKEIAEMLDLVLPYGVGGTFTGGIWWLWKKIYGEETPPDGAETALTVNQHGGQTTIVRPSDGGTVTVNNNVYVLATDPDMVALGKKVVQPLKREGYETLGFYRGDKPTVVWDKDEAKRFIRAPTDSLMPANDDDQDVNKFRFPATVSVKTQRNQGKAQWEIKWANKAEMASMEDLDWLEDFQAGRVPFTLPYWLEVTLEMVTSKIDPDAPPTFAIKKVHKLINSPEGKQSDWLDEEPEDRD